MLTFKALSVLLEYPNQDLLDNLEKVKAAITSEALIPAKQLKPLFCFMDEMAPRKLLQLQEDYVDTFDRSRANSLYLFEHVHGESRDRGQAMVDLIEQYQTHGYDMGGAELPDFIPLFLEFLSILPVKQAQEYLNEVIHLIAAIGAKLKDKENGYADVFRALQALGSVKIDKEFVDQAVRHARNEDTSLDAMDREWEEAPAFDGADSASCQTCPEATRHPSYANGSNVDQITGGSNA
jgi:nitrate reductase molybdenum cofactor assembly chaperone NarJ/NarW